VTPLAQRLAVLAIALLVTACAQLPATLEAAPLPAALVQPNGKRLSDAPPKLAERTDADGVG